MEDETLPRKGDETIAPIAAVEEEGAKEQEVVIEVKLEEKEDIAESIQFVDLMRRAMEVLREEEESEDGSHDSVKRDNFLALADTHFDALVSASLENRRSRDGTGWHHTHHRPVFFHCP